MEDPSELTSLGEAAPAVRLLEGARLTTEIAALGAQRLNEPYEGDYVLALRITRPSELQRTF